MCHRRLSALALIATGALAVTTMSVPPSFAADSNQAEASSSSAASTDEAVTVIVRLNEGVVGQDRAAAYRDIAAKTGVTPEAAGQATAKQLYSRLAPGQYWKPLDGGWVKK